MSNCDTNLVEPSEKDILNIANKVITHCNLSVPPLVRIADINSNLIGLLFEKITGLSVSDFVPGEEAHNIQAVINSLSSDVLQLSLSHIKGKDVAVGNNLAVYNLLHILEGILQHSSSHKEQKFHKKRRSERRHGHTSKENISVPLDAEKIFEKNAKLKLQTKVFKDKHLQKSKSYLAERNQLLQQMQQPESKPNFPRPCVKSYLLPYTLRKKQSSHSPTKRDSKKQKPPERERRRTHSTTRDHHKLLQNPSHFIQELLDEFPCIQISPSMMRKIEKMYAHQLKRMLKIGRKCLSEKSKAAVETENIFQRQFKLAEILKKDMQQQNYLNEVREKRENEMKIRCSLRDSRMKSARMKQYTDEFVLEMRRKMLSRTTNIAEELIFKRVFEEVMEIQNEHVNDLCQQVREARVEDDQRYLNYLNSLENEYQTQYLALAEEIANERTDTQLRLRDEKEAFSKTEREFREKLKREIRFMQQVIVEQAGDTHFREMDADMCIEQRRRQFRPHNY